MYLKIFKGKIFHTQNPISFECTTKQARHMGNRNRAKAACSVQTSPSGWHNESDLYDFHELRQDFSPMIVVF